MKITRSQLRRIIKESIGSDAFALPEPSLLKLYSLYIGDKSEHLQAISLADGFGIDHAGLVKLLIEFREKEDPGYGSYDFASIMGYNFQKFYGDNHPVDAYAFAPHENDFEESAYDYLVDEMRKTDTGPQAYGEDIPRGV